MTIKRITFLQELLAFIGLEERLHLSWISSAEAGKFIEVVSGFTEKIRSIGPNPLKGFDLEPWLKQMDTVHPIPAPSGQESSAETPVVVK